MCCVYFCLCAFGAILKQSELRTSLSPRKITTARSLGRVLFLLFHENDINRNNCVLLYTVDNHGL